MAGDVDLAYDSDGVRTGGRQAAGAGAVAADAADILRAAHCPQAAFGVVAGVEALATAVARARATHTALGERVHADHVDLNSRAGQVADSGDGMTADTANVARTGAPGAGR
jgi:hypothetical protein